MAAAHGLPTEARASNARLHRGYAGEEGSVILSGGMGSDTGEVLSKIDLDVLGGAMLEAARAARIGVTVTLVEPPEPRIVYVNEAAAEVFGWPWRRCSSVTRCRTSLPPKCRAPSTDSNAVARGECGPISYELGPAQGRDRDLIEVSTTHAMLGGKRAVFAFIVDVSARHEAEKQRLRNDARFRELIEIAPEPVSIIRDGHFVYVNPAYVSALGYPDAAALYAVPLSPLVDEQDRPVRVGA